MKDVLKNRKSIRKFKSDDIDNSVINELLSDAFYASTTGNMQLYSVVVTKDKEQKGELAPSHFSQPAFMNAPVIITFCADYNRFIKWCKQRNAEPGYNNFQSFITASIDALLVAQTFSMLAEEKGLGICYLGTTTYNPDKIAKVLDLPKFVVPITTLAVGYPDESPEKQDRLPAKGLIHYETYKDYSNEEIDELYYAKENLTCNKNFVEINNKETLAQIFTDIRYTKKDNEYFSQVLLDFLKQQGFVE